MVDNAVKFSPGGARIDVSVTLAEPEQVQIEVADQGEGIPAEHLPHIFERAYQGGEVHRMAGPGLGLFISRQVVELHGGRIDAASPPEGGARLTITLPTRPPVAV